MSRYRVLILAKELDDAYKEYRGWVDSFLRTPCRETKARVREKSVKLSSLKTKLNQQIQGSLVKDEYETRASQEVI